MICQTTFLSKSSNNYDTVKYTSLFSKQRIHLPTLPWFFLGEDFLGLADWLDPKISISATFSAFFFTFVADFPPDFPPLCKFCMYIWIPFLAEVAFHGLLFGILLRGDFFGSFLDGLFFTVFCGLFAGPFVAGAVLTVFFAASFVLEVVEVFFVEDLVWRGFFTVFFLEAVVVFIAVFFGDALETRERKYFVYSVLKSFSVQSLFCYTWCPEKTLLFNTLLYSTPGPWPKFVKGVGCRTQKVDLLTSQKTHLWPNFIMQ